MEADAGGGFVNTRPWPSEAGGRDQFAMAWIGGAGRRLAAGAVKPATKSPSAPSKLPQRPPSSYYKPTISRSDANSMFQSNKPTGGASPNRPQGGPKPLVAMNGCPVHELKAKLRYAGMRPTRQRIALGWLLFAKGPRHITAEKLYDEASAARVAVSLATIYNTLHQFTRAGLLREIAAEGAKTYFDTNVSDHHHFMFESSNRLIDIDRSEIEFAKLPPVPEGMEVARIDVVVRLRPKADG
jgi:Fur family transcriptional regulator, iron response regulator